eukprot:4308171-Ditylum_brightwellii.AAC.2
MEKTMIKAVEDKIMNEHEESANHFYLQRAVHAVFGQQMSAKKGIEKYGATGLAAVVKEFT